jgi:hypothetical protein
MDGLDACFMDDGDEGGPCAFCEEEGDFWCYQCSESICIAHSVPVALGTYYCGGCAAKAGIQLHGVEEEDRG